MKPNAGLPEAIPLATASKIGFRMGPSEHEEIQFIDSHYILDALRASNWTWH